MFFRNCGFNNNVAGRDNGTPELEPCIHGMRTACRQELRDRPTALRGYDLLAGVPHTIENRQAPSFEFGRIDALHRASIRRWEADS